MRFHVDIPARGPYHGIYDKKWQELYEEYQAAIPSLNGLTIDQPKLRTFMDCRKLTVLEEIGRGLSAVVYKAIDSRGFLYAVKSFNLLQPPPNATADTFEWGRGLKNNVIREVDLLKSMKHVDSQALQGRIIF